MPTLPATARSRTPVWLAVAVVASPAAATGPAVTPASAATSGGTLVVDAGTVVRPVMAAGTKMTIDLADIYDGFPYRWGGWADWRSRVDKMIAAVKARPDVTNVNA
ncbi:hypothetical protein [Streptomyces asiaticus]